MDEDDERGGWARHLAETVSFLAILAFVFLLVYLSHHNWNF